MADAFSHWVLPSLVQKDKNMKKLRRLWFRLFHTYECLGVRCVAYERADQLIRDSEGKPETEQWVICSRLEDKNRMIGVCWLEQRRRIVE